MGPNWRSRLVGSISHQPRFAQHWLLLLALFLFVYLFIYSFFGIGFDFDFDFCFWSAINVELDTMTEPSPLEPAS